jgi:hypothetical protein
MATPLKKYDAASLKRLMRWWQKKLRLCDWVVTVRFAKQEEFEDGDGQGQNNWNLHARSSEILILHPDEYNPADYPNSIPQDIEDCLVHELLHLHLATWNTKNRAEGVHLEQAVEAVTGCMIALRRRSK